MDVLVPPSQHLSGILDEFALQALDQTETADFYELVVERHLKAPPDHPQPDTGRMASSHGLPPPSPIGHRPARLILLRARHRRRVLPPAAEANTSEDKTTNPNQTGLTKEVPPAT